MNSFLSTISSFSATKLSCIANNLCKSLLRVNTCSSSSINAAVPLRSKCFDHHFLNRWMARDYKRRMLVKEHFLVRQRLVAIKRCSVLPKEIQEVAAQEIDALPRDAHPTRLRNRCILTSRPRWVIWRFRLSRIQWRLLADYNKLSGVHRAIW